MNCLFLSLLLAHSACFSVDDTNRSALQSRIAGIIQHSSYKHAHWGILVFDQESGESIYQHQAEKLFCPASVTKLYSVTAAWKAFGADHQFRTPVYQQGEVKEGVLQGNLILVASGDLNMGGRTGPDGKIQFTDYDHTYANGTLKGQLTMANPLAGLESLARQIKDKGIHSLRGDIIIDDRLFEKSESTGSGPSRLTPIMINDNLIDFTMTPSEVVGDAVTVVHRPASIGLQVDAQLKTVSENEPVLIRITSAGSMKVVLRGQIPVKHKPIVKVHEVDDPASWARTLFIEALEKQGVKVTASPLQANRNEALPSNEVLSKLSLVAELKSLPFSEQAKLILKVSHNLHASTLPLLLAAKQGERTLAQGLKHQSELLHEWGVPLDDIAFGGGAGGSRADAVTPQATVALLRGWLKRDDFPLFHSTLPNLGVDGTLASSIPPESSARGKFFAKTGTYTMNNALKVNDLLNSKALAGFGTTASGRRIVFAFFVNNALVERGEGATKVGKDLGKLCEVIFQEVK